MSLYQLAIQDAPKYTKFEQEKIKVIMNRLQSILDMQSILDEYGSVEEEMVYGCQMLQEKLAYRFGIENEEPHYDDFDKEIGKESYRTEELKILKVLCKLN